jgi:hypothetical protein
MAFSASFYNLLLDNPVTCIEGISAGFSDYARLGDGQRCWLEIEATYVMQLYRGWRSLFSHQRDGQ